MLTDPRQILRAALEHHVAVYGPHEFVRDSASDTNGRSDAPPTADLATAADTQPPAIVPVVEPAAQPDPRPAPAKSATRQGPPADAPAESDPYDRIKALIPADSPLHALGTLAEVEAWVRETVLIPLDATRTNPVFGVGDPEADLMVIGEAPGAEEDRKGEPFVGRAGKLLDQILAAIGFARDQVYIANILKSRPPDNRNPQAEETAAHIPILYRQISLIRPRLILCVGKTSGTGLLGRNDSLKAMRGTFHDFHGIPLMVTYHPAALLRNPNWKRPTWEDVKLLRARYDELAGTA